MKGKIHLKDTEKEAMSEEREFYTTRELARLLQVAEMTIYRMVRRGELPCHNIGRAKRFRRGDVEAFLKRCRMDGGNYDQD